MAATSSGINAGSRPVASASSCTFEARSRRRLPAEKHALFKQIVYDGIIHGAGMPRMGDLINEQDVHDIQAYIVERAKQDRAAAAAAAMQ